MFRSLYIYVNNFTKLNPISPGLKASKAYVDKDNVENNIINTVHSQGYF